MTDVDTFDARPAVERSLTILAAQQLQATHDPKAWNIRFGKIQFQRR